MTLKEPVIARPFMGRGNPEDWCTNDHIATPTSIAGIATLCSR